MPSPLPLVEPMPPHRGGLPWAGAGPAMLRNPTEFFAACRARYGETFVVDVFGRRLFCVFSPEGVQRLYELPEEEASFGLATFELLRAKVPIEVFLGRRNRPHELFGGSDVEHYLNVLEYAVGREIDELGAQGTFEIFARMRRIGHRLGFATWAGREAASPPWFDPLVQCFDRLDSSEAFVNPLHGLLAQATGQRRERRAMAQIERIFEEILRARAARGANPDGDFLDRIHASFADVPEDERAREVARDAVVLHMGSQSNLYAALAWTLTHLLLHPSLFEQVRAGDDHLLEQAANESIRLAQRSITLRQVLREVTLDDGEQSYRIAPGVQIATMLSVTNPSAAAGFERFDPERYEGRRLRCPADLPARELVSTFGHGRHACPAQRFAISAIRITIRRLLDAFDIEPLFRSAEPRRRQLGGVARAQHPCRVRYRQRSAAAGG